MAKGYKPKLRYRLTTKFRKTKGGTLTEAMKGYEIIHAQSEKFNKTKGHSFKRNQEEHTNLGSWLWLVCEEGWSERRIRNTLAQDKQRRRLFNT